MVSPATYAIFERILREAPRADKYECMPRADFGPDGFDRLPWGQHDAIVRVEWRPTNALASPGKANFVAIGCTHDDGIWIQNCFTEFGSHAVGREGAMPGNRRDVDLNNPLVLNRHTFATDDEVVQKVLELIAERDCAFEEDEYV